MNTHCHNVCWSEVYDIERYFLEESGLINNMDTMYISGNEPSSVTLSQTKWYQKLKMIALKCQKQTEAKKDGVIKPQNFNFQSI